MKPTPVNQSLAWPKTAVWPAVANHNEVRRVQLGAPETAQNTWPDIVSQVPVHHIGSPLLYPGGILRPRSSGNFSAFRVYSFWGLLEIPVIERDNMSGLKNWPVFESGHVRYRKPSPPITSGDRICLSLTRFLRIEPDFMFLGRFGMFPLLCHVDMCNTLM